MKAMAKSKTALVALVVVGAAFALLATACTSPAGEDVSKRMDDLEGRVKILEDKLVTKADEGRDTLKTYSDTEDYATYDRYLADIEKRIDDAIVAAEQAAPGSNSDQKMREYDKAVIPLEDLEEELSHLEDAVEAAYSSGYLTEDEYQTLKAAGENLDVKIDASIDKVKSNFGVDD